LVEQVGDRPKTPAWSLAVGGAGWLLTILGSLFGLSHAVVLLTKGGSVALAGVGLFASISAAVLFGRLLVVVASAGQTDRRVHRLQLWARLTWIVGLLLSISWPCYLLGRMLWLLELMRRFGAEAFFQFTCPSYVVMALPPILLSLVAIGCAEFWGRRPPPADFSDVFS